MKTPLRLALLSFLLVSLACSFPQYAQYTQPDPPQLVFVSPNPDASATPTPFQPLVPGTPTPTLAYTFTPLPPSDTPPPTLEFTATALPPPTSAPATARTQYTMFVLLDYQDHQVGADETIRYTNQTGVALDELVMAVEPNLRGGFSVENMMLDGNQLNYELNGQWLTVHLPQPLAPGAQAAITMRFRIDVPAKVKDQPYGYDVDQVNLTDWYPFIVPYNNGWVLHDPSNVGEHLVYEAADFDVNLKTTQPDVVIAASGLEEPNGEWTRYRINGARTFAFSASDQFQIVDATAGGATIRSYYYPGYEAQGAAILNAAVREIGLFEVKIAPYPYGSLSIVQADLNDGQEYDGLVFLATKFYNEYNGSARSNLVTIGVHEIAHQWWFGLVGNDQAMEPWLDEALAVYSEAIFYRYIYPNSYDWWWSFRVNYFGPSGYVDSNVYNSGTFRAYVNAVYLNGANFLEALNNRMGEDAFFKFLQDYATRYGRGIATTSDFFAVARQNTTADISDLISAYFAGSY
jgi:hypothetical protein